MKLISPKRKILKSNMANGHHIEKYIFGY